MALRTPSIPPLFKPVVPESLPATTFRIWGQTGILSFQKQVELISKAAELEGLTVTTISMEQNIKPLKYLTDKQVLFVVAMPHVLNWVFRVSWAAYARSSLAYMTCEGDPLIGDHIKHLMRGVRTVGVSRFAADRLREAGCNVQGVVPHAVDPEEFTGHEEEAGDIRRPYPDKFIVGYVGSPIPRKGLALLGEAAKIIEEKGVNDIVFLLHTQRYQDCLIPAGPNIVQRLNFGQYTRGQMVAFYKALDLYVQPSLAEGFCIPMLEAMAAGKALVSSNGGPMGELNAADHGYLVNATEVKKLDQGMGQAFWLYSYSPIDLADRILQAHDNPKDLLEKGAKGLELSSRYDYRTVYKQLVRQA
jgi:glycosyltransferase involved in cell wall biosynthesis